MKKSELRQIIKEEMPHTYNAGTPLEMTLKVDIDFYEWEWYSKKVKLAWQIATTFLVFDDLKEIDFG